MAKRAGSASPPDSDVESKIDRLYQAPLADFVRVRQQLAAELRDAGQRDAAARVKTLTKPSATAWAVNQTWWRARDAVEAMLAAGAAVRETQAAAFRGKHADLRTALAERQRAIEAVADVAVEALAAEGGVSDAFRRRIVGTLEAIATTGAPADEPLGRFTTDRTSTGLDVLGALAAGVPALKVVPRPAPPAPSPAPATRRSGSARSDEEERAARAEAERVARERREQARADLDERERALRTAEQAVQRATFAEREARAAQDAAVARVAQLEDELRAARDTVTATRRALSEATARLRRDTAALEGAAGDVRAARKRLDASHS